jgi:hypothetical protein
VTNNELAKFNFSGWPLHGDYVIEAGQVSAEDVRRRCVQIDEANRALYKLVLKRELPSAWKART